MYRLFSIFLFIMIFPNPMVSQDSELIKEQKKIIAELSGYHPLKNGKTITARSTKEEREIARQNLFDLFESIDLKSEYQEYLMPNVNPLVDLLFDPYKGANVYTILPSTVKSDVHIVLGAHFDTDRNCPGAIDNASGIVIAFGVLKKLSRLKQRNVNVILVYFDQEEEDLVGSQAFAKMLKDEEFNVLSVHTLDTMGWDRDGDKAVELELPTEYLENLYTEKAAELNIPIYTTKVNSTDHHSFRELGFNTTGLTDEYLNGDYAPFKDTPKDTYETVNFNYVASCTELIYQVTKELIQN